MQMSEEIQTAEKIIIPHISTKLPLPLFDGATAMLLFCATASYLGFKEVAKDAFLFQNALVGAWWLSHIADVIATYKMNKIDLWMDFGIDSKNIPEMGLPTRKQEARELADKVNDLYVPNQYSSAECAALSNKALTDYIFSITGQVVESTDKFRTFGANRIFFPFARGACDPISGEVYLYKSEGVFDAHTFCHEFAHRKGYTKELEAQVLSYFALSSSNDPVLVQSADCERLLRDISVIAKDERKHKLCILSSLGLRKEMFLNFRTRFECGLFEKIATAIMLPIYNLRMKLTGQNGLSDYNRGFTNFIYAVENKQ